MELRYHRRFERDVRQIRNPNLLRRLEQTIEELKAASNIMEVRNTLKMEGWDHHYRIRIGPYRLGIEMDDATVLLVRFGHRRDFYRGFP